MNQCKKTIQNEAKIKKLRERKKERKNLYSGDFVT